MYMNLPKDEIMSSNNPPHRENSHGKDNNKEHRKHSSASANSSNSPHHSNASALQGHPRNNPSGVPGGKAGLKKIFGVHSIPPKDLNMVPVGVTDALAIPDRFSEYSSPDPYLAEIEQPTPKLHILNLPENVMENLFTYVGLCDLRNCALVCVEWSRLLSDENNDVWRSHCFRRMNREVIYSDLLSSCVTYKAKLRAYFHAWNPQDCSRNIYVKPNGFTIHRNPVAQSTDGARGQIGFSKGRHAWEIVWEGPLGTVAVVGIATQQAEMRAQGYIALLGQDEQSWGWNLVENMLLHSGDSQGNYPLINNAPRYQVGEKIRVILDCEDNTLSFEKNFEFLGVAFRGLPNRELLYPAISAVYGNTEVSMVYLGPPLDG